MEVRASTRSLTPFSSALCARGAKVNFLDGTYFCWHTTVRLTWRYSDRAVFGLATRSASGRKLFECRFGYAAIHSRACPPNVGRRAADRCGSINIRSTLRRTRRLYCSAVSTWTPGRLYSALRARSDNRSDKPGYHYLVASTSQLHFVVSKSHKHMTVK